MKVLIALAALILMSTGAMAGDYHGIRGELPRPDCHFLVQNNPHDAWANCPEPVRHAWGHSPDGSVVVEVKEPEPEPEPKPCNEYEKKA